MLLCRPIQSEAQRKKKYLRSNETYTNNSLTAQDSGYIKYKKLELFLYTFLMYVVLLYFHFSLATAHCNVTLQYMHPVIFRSKLHNKHATWQLVNCWIPKSGLVFCRNLRFTKRNWIKRLLMMLLLWRTLGRLYSIRVINMLK